jgi:hypothetical protein
MNDPATLPEYKFTTGSPQLVNRWLTNYQMGANDD